MSKIWFTSDTHAFHKNICKGVTAWANTEPGDIHGGQTCRDFRDQYEMTEHLIETFNKYVQQDDELYHLGDWSFGGVDKIGKFRDRLVVQKIHLCYGNHDHNIIHNRLTQSHDKEIGAKLMFESTQDIIWNKIGNNEFFLSHYSHQVWPGSHKNVIHLFGHSHDSLSGIGRSMDVGVDSAKRILGEYRPFSITEILDIMNKKSVIYVDHHRSNTNVK